MSYPTTVPNSFEGYDLTSSNRGDNWIRTATATYLFCRQGGFATIATEPSPQFASGDLHMYAFKSTDDGLTWTSQGSVDTLSSGGVGGGFGGVGPICRDGDTVYFVGVTTISGATSGIIVFAFDTLTDTWDGGTSAATPLPVWNTSWPGVLARMVTYGPGSMAMVYNGAPENIAGTDYARMYFVTFNGSGWGTPVAIPDESGNQIHYVFTDLLVDSGGKTHLIYGTEDGSGNTNVCHRTLDGTWSAEQQVVTSVSVNPDQTSNLVQYGTDLGFAAIFDDGSPNGELRFYYGSDVDSPTWSSTSLGVISSSLEVPFGNFTGVVGRAFSLSAHSSNSSLYLFQCNSQGGASPPAGKVLYSTASWSTPTSWSGPTLLLNTPAVTQTGATDPANQYGAHAVASFDDAAGIFVAAEWECSGTDSGAENMQFTLLPICPITIGCGSPPSGTVGTPYTHTFPASGSTAIFYSIASGSLPDGLSLDPATGVVSGTPTAAGSFPFVVQASYAQIMATGDDGSFSDSEIVITSVDGSTWTQQTTAITDSGYSVTYSEALGLWINGTNFAGTTEQIQTSPDGLTGDWTAQSSPADGTGWVKKMVSGKDKMVALYQISSVMHIMTSTDGVTWTARTAPATIASSADVAYSPDLDLYCIAQATFGTPGVLTSPDGITWTFQNVGTNLPAAAITWGAGLFVVVGGPQGSGVHLMTSPDGVTWTVQANPGGSTQNWAAIHYANGIFVMTSVDTSTNPNNQAATSTDGINWTIRATPGTTKHWACVSYGYGKWISGALNSQNTQPLMVSSDNGVTWSLVSAMSFSFGFITGIAFGPTAGCTASASCSISISAGGTFGNVFGAVSFTQSTANIFI